MKICCALLFWLVFALTTQAQDPQPYAGEQNRGIKALSDVEISAYLNGRGMGFAKAAELNGYPGPAHVLDLADELKLTSEQRMKAQELKDTMVNAAQAGTELVNAERALDRLFSEGKATYHRITPLVERIGQLQAEIRLVHLRAHIEMRKALTDDQVSKYKELRGYAAK